MTLKGWRIVKPQHNQSDQCIPVMLWKYLPYATFAYIAPDKALFFQPNIMYRNNTLYWDTLTT